MQEVLICRPTRGGCADKGDGSSTDIRAERYQHVDDHRTSLTHVTIKTLFARYSTPFDSSYPSVLTNWQKVRNYIYAAGCGSVVNCRILIICLHAVNH
jgi:hypothetical protein